MDIRDLPLVDASVPETATLAEAVEALFAAQAPAVAVVDPGRRLVALLTDGDVLRAVFPRYLGELRHTSFLTDDLLDLDGHARLARDEPVRNFARVVEPLDGAESHAHAAERFMHAGEQALPVVEQGRFTGILTISALCHARLDQLVDD